MDYRVFLVYEGWFYNLMNSINLSHSSTNAPLLLNRYRFMPIKITVLLQEVGTPMTEATKRAVSIEKIISTVGELPASPAIVSSVMGLTSNLDTDVDQLGKVLSTDQALSAKVLKLSNSSFYGRSKGVGTLKEAILILGFYTLRSLVIASSTHSLYKRKDESQFEQKLWEHSLATAMAGRLVCSKIRHKQIEETFIAGLLHDIGKLVLSQKLSEEYDKICLRVESESASFIDIERDELGFSHVEVAQLLLTKWNFPQFLTDAICAHHNPEQIDEEFDPDNPKSIPVPYLVQFANNLAKHVDCGFSDFKQDNLSESMVAKAAGFDAEKIDELIAELSELFQAEKHLFDD